MTFPLLGRRPRRDESGIVLPTRALALAISAIGIGLLVFIADDPDTSSESAKAAQVTEKVTTPTSAAPAPTLQPKPEPVVDRSATPVEVYNNTRTRGLAGVTADRARNAGWNVVGEDNWYGTFEGSTVYHPRGWRTSAAALARDLGIKLVKPAIAPMQFDRLTVVLTDSYR